jgi:thymidylate synthase (FAD)
LKAEYIDHMGTDQSVVKAARVSFANSGDEGRTIEQDAKLISYLAKHNHWTPFAHTAITLRMQAPVPIRTQCFKHKVGFSENEESRRYINSEPTFFTPQFRKSVANKKQGSGEEFDEATQRYLKTYYNMIMLAAIVEYEELLEMGVCEEQARFVLPQGTEVNWYWTGSLAAYARFCKQRMDPHAQLEIQELAQEVSNIIEPLFPVAWKALMGD